MEKLEDISKLEVWFVNYIKGIDTDVAKNLQGYDEPDTEELDSLLSAVEKPMRFKIIFSTRGTEDLTALHYAVKWSHQDVCHTLLANLSREDKIRILWASPAVYKCSLPKNVRKLLTVTHKCIAYIRSNSTKLFVASFLVLLVSMINALDNLDSMKERMTLVLFYMNATSVVTVIIIIFTIYLEQYKCLGVVYSAERYAFKDNTQKTVFEPLEFLKYVNKEQSDNVLSIQFMVIRKNLSVMFYALDKQEILKTFFDEFGNQNYKELRDYSYTSQLPFGFGKLTGLKNVLDAYYTYMFSLHNAFKKVVPTSVAGMCYRTVHTAQ